MSYASFRKLGVPYFGVLIIRILLFRVLYWGPLFSETPKWRFEDAGFQRLLFPVLTISPKGIDEQAGVCPLKTDTRNLSCKRLRKPIPVIGAPTCGFQICA